MIITNEVFGSYSQCKLKSFLVSAGRVGNKCDYKAEPNRPASPSFELTTSSGCFAENAENGPG
jgi:hypothetical protein